MPTRISGKTRSAPAANVHIRHRARRDVIVIGASAGGLEALRLVLDAWPGRLAASVFVVIHAPGGAPHLLAPILERASGIPAGYPADGETVARGHIYVAPPDHHLILESGRMRVTRGPKENGFRPAIDPLFRTAAAAYGNRVIGVLLSGGLNDGTLGMAAIKKAGGITIAQSPDEAVVPAMPESAIEYVGVHHVLRAAGIRSYLLNQTRGLGHTAMVTRSTPPQMKRPAKTLRKPDPAEVGANLLDATRERPAPSVFICPDCGGTLWETEETGVLQYRCHVGHAYTGEALVSLQAEVLEHAMWTALRTLEDGAALRQRMEEHARERGLTYLADRYAEQRAEFKERAAIVRKALVVDSETPRANRPPEAIEARARAASKT